MPLLILTADDVCRLLPAITCIELMDQAMRASSSGRIISPSRLVTELADGSGKLFTMPGALSDPPVYGAKLVSAHAGNPAQGLPAIQGFVCLFEHHTGAPVAIIEGASLTAIRTAAASALATRELARTNACSHGIFGTGVQALSHLDAIACVRPTADIRVWNRDKRRAEAFVARHERSGLSMVACENPADVAACDVVSTVTAAEQPVLRGEWLKEGSHINLVGAHAPTAREADGEVMARSSVYVDRLAAAMSESGDILMAMAEGRMTQDDIRGEIGQVLSGEIDGRSDQRQITLYKSLGIVGQDLFAAEWLYREAVRKAAGQQTEL